MARTSLVVFQLALVLSIQFVIGQDERANGLVINGLNGLSFIGDCIESRKETDSTLIDINTGDIKNIGGDFQRAIKSAFWNNKILNVALSPEEEENTIEFSFLEAGLVKPDVVRKIASSLEIKLWLARAIQVYKIIVGNATVNSKCIASTLADADTDAIKKMCEHVKEAFGSASLNVKALDVALSSREEEEAIEFSFFLPMMSMVNAGLIKPDVVKKIASSPEIMSRLAAFIQEYRISAGDATMSLEGSAHLLAAVDIDEMKRMDEHMKEVFQSADLNKVSDVALSPEQDEKVIEMGFFPLVAMAMLD